MKQSGMLTGISAAITMLLLILDSQTALQGAQEGISLCIRTVIPSLFPFFVLSSLLTGALSGKNFRFLRPLTKLTGIPSGAESILLSGFLGGYPIGARCIAAAHRQGVLTGSVAARMMAFCNNAGPAFIFGIAAAMFEYPWVGWALWGIHILSALAAAILLPGAREGKSANFHGSAPSLPGAAASSIHALALVCGWVVLFRVLLAFLNRWFLWLAPKEFRVLLAGLLELTNGCCTLSAIENTGLRFVVCSGLLAFGGLCVSMQTYSVAHGVSLRYYFPGKLIQTVISILLALFVQASVMESQIPIHPMVPLLPLLLLFLPHFFQRKSQNSSSIPGKLVV